QKFSVELDVLAAGSQPQLLARFGNEETTLRLLGSDGRWLILTTCPQDGRRIVAVDTDRGVALDLSQPGWDAWAALLPKSGELLLHNGRGELWRSRLTVPPVSP
ncbi:MAG TPA: hypothetical protein PLZ56_13935, partial [Anaerolineae bacterium]|nr:hypothetical protein [Anaerolineae bacterium]